MNCAYDLACVGVRHCHNICEPAVNRRRNRLLPSCSSRPAVVRCGYKYPCWQGNFDTRGASDRSNNFATVDLDNAVLREIDITFYIKGVIADSLTADRRSVTLEQEKVSTNYRNATTLDNRVSRNDDVTSCSGSVYTNSSDADGDDNKSPTVINHEVLPCCYIDTLVLHE